MNFIRLLIVEDDVALAKAMSASLADYGYEVIVANCVSDAIELLASDSFHVLIVDWILERKLGRTVMEFARATVPELPIICFSAHVTTDSECAHWADEFVQKCSTGAERLRSAIVRRLNSSFISMQSERTLGKELLDIYQISREQLDEKSVELGKSLLLWGESPDLCRDLILQLLPVSYRRGCIEIDCSKPDFEMSQIVGRCELAGENSTLARGCLDSVRSNWCSILNVDSLEKENQKLLAAIIGNQQVQRIGATRVIPIECFIGLSANSLIGVEKELLDVVTQRFQIPSPTSFLCKQLAIESDATKTDSNLASLEDDLRNSNYDIDSCWQSLDIPTAFKSIGPRILAELFLNSASDNDSRKSWKYVERFAKLLYLGQVLGETNGNVSLASKWSGLRRNAIYDLLRDFGLTPQAFRDDSREKV